jgi:starch synthase
MRLLYLAAEAAPLIKVGGLADVAGDLPRALVELGVEARLAIPYHPGLDTAGLTLRHAASMDLPSTEGPTRAEIIESEVDGLHLLLIGGEPIRSARAVYTDAADDGRKYAFFSLATLAACRALSWPPDVVHSNDWHTAPAVLWLAAHRRQDPFWGSVATVLTIHNLAYMGAGSEQALGVHGLASSQDERLPLWARSLPLPLGLAASDWLTTVSPSYAQEIQTPEYGCGLEDLLRGRRDRLTGILNGIDGQRWDPSHDPALIASYSSDDVAPRAANKRALQAEFGLPGEPGVPLLAMVTRLDHQKGVDLALAALEALAEMPWQFIVLGTGDEDLQSQARSLLVHFPTKARAIFRFDPDLSRRLYGGADLLLVPSRYEPCGLVQMIGMRYGCLPLVRSTGGLKDSVVDETAGESGTGFVFESADASALVAAIRRALEAYGQPRRWRALQRQAMTSDFSWVRSAERYLQVYREAGESRTL